MEQRLEKRDSTIADLEWSRRRSEATLADLRAWLDESLRGAERSWRRLPLDKSRPLDGVIAHPTRAHGGNVADTEAASITASTTPSDDPPYTSDLGTASLWLSKDEPGQWIRDDFNERPVRPAARSRTSCGFHPKSWGVEVSSDGSRWSVIDRREDNSNVNGRAEDEGVRFRRLRGVPDDPRAADGEDRPRQRLHSVLLFRGFQRPF